MAMREVQVVDALFYDLWRSGFSFWSVSQSPWIVPVSMLKDGVNVELRLWYINGVTGFCYGAAILA